MDISFDDARALAATLLGAVGGGGLVKAVLDYRDKGNDRRERELQRMDDLEQRLIDRLTADNLAQKQEMADMDERCDRRLQAQDVRILNLEQRLEDCLRNRWDRMAQRDQPLGPEIPPERGNQ